MPDFLQDELRGRLEKTPREYMEDRLRKCKYHNLQKIKNDLFFKNAFDDSELLYDFLSVCAFLGDLDKDFLEIAKEKQLDLKHQRLASVRKCIIKLQEKLNAGKERLQIANQKDELDLSKNFKYRLERRFKRRVQAMRYPMRKWVGQYAGVNKLGFFNEGMGFNHLPKRYFSLSKTLLAYAQCNAEVRVLHRKIHLNQIEGLQQALVNAQKYCGQLQRRLQVPERFWNLKYYFSFFERLIPDFLKSKQPHKY